MKIRFLPLFALALTACSAHAQEAVVAAPVATPDPMLSLTDEERSRLITEGAKVLFWSQEQRSADFRQMETLFPGRIAQPVSPRTLERGEELPGADALDAYLAENDLVGLMVLQGGKVRYEGYAQGMTEQDRWASFSVAKSVTSLLVGAALRDGAIDSLEDMVTTYVGELEGTAYEGVSVADLLTMRSGVDWNENYADPESDIAQIFSQPYRPGIDPNLDYLSTLERAAPPGETFNYNTAETNLVGLVVERATGRSLTDYAAEKIVGPAGFEGEMFWQVDSNVGNVGGCCISLRLSDYARLGQWVMEGAPGDVIAEGYLKAATEEHVTFGNGRGYGYFWWTAPGEAYSAIGIFGQGIYVDPKRQVVVAYLGNWEQATGVDRSAILKAVQQAFLP